jgi:DNA-binding SARP family transcriptional activator/DNA-binding HxlR family transcriptional regulator
LTHIVVVENGLASVRRRTGNAFSADRALKALGDKWGLLVLSHTLGRRSCAFAELRRDLEVSENILTTRLERLVSSGLMRKVDEGRALSEAVFTVTEEGGRAEAAVSALVSWTSSTASANSVTRRRAAAVVPMLGDAETAEDGTVAEPVIAVSEIRIDLLGAFTVMVHDEEAAPLSSGSQRLLAFLALHDRVVARSAIAGKMWPDVSEENAAISLRSALSRFDVASREAIISTSTGLGLAPGVSVDLRAARSLARRLIEPGSVITDDDLSGRATAALSAEILPDWYDEWVVAETEDWRQLRIAALEAQSAKLIAAGRLAEAGCAARSAMKADELRESSAAALMRVHLAEGNQSEAVRVYSAYRDLLEEALGIEPTPHLTSLLRGLRRSAPTRVPQAVGH